jgi:hypothetical protein
MSPDSTAATSCLGYQLIFDDALEVYRMKTGTDLCSHPLFSKFETCDSPNTALLALQQQIPGFDVPGNTNSNDKNLTKWLDPTIKVLMAFSSIVGGGASLASTITPNQTRTLGGLKFENLHRKGMPARRRHIERNRRPPVGECPLFEPPPRVRPGVSLDRSVM